ncbi:hypothetical protein BRN20_00635, partial [Xanthomonas oryzae pv. oryzae]
TGPGGWMTWATPFGSEVAQVRSPGPLHKRWCCESELKPPSKKASVCTGENDRYIVYPTSPQV